MQDFKDPKGLTPKNPFGKVDFNAPVSKIEGKGLAAPLPVKGSEYAVLKGVKGDKGDSGEKGDVGLTGPRGPTGPQGVMGLTGIQGPIGPRGIQGLQGIQGIQGNVGPIGPMGPKGDKGDRGEPGPIGEQRDNYIIGGGQRFKIFSSGPGVSLLFKENKHSARIKTLLGSGITFSDNGNGVLTLTAAVAAQTPWTSDINGASHNLQGVNTVTASHVQTTSLENFASGTISVLSNLDLNGHNIINLGTSFQTPWTTDIDGNSFNLSNVLGINTLGTITLGYGGSLNFTGGGGGSIDLAGGNINNINSINSGGGELSGFSVIADNTTSAAIDINNHLLFSIGASQNLIDFSGTQDGFAAQSFDSSGNVYFTQQINGNGGGITNISSGSISGLAAVATSGNYNDLNSVPIQGGSPPYSLNGNISTNTYAIVFNGGSTLQDQSDNNSVDPANRFLYGADGSTKAIDYSMVGFNSSAAISFGISGVLDTYIGGVIRSGSDTNTSVNCNARTLGDSGNNTSIDWTNRFGLASDGSTQIFNWNSTGGLKINKVINNYNGTATVAGGVDAIRGNGRFTGQVAAKASVATFTPSADGSFRVSANILITASTLYSFTATCTYTDEGNTSRTLTLPFVSIAGTVLTTLANAAGAVPYEGVPVHIRAKSGTAITIATTGTFTTVTYNVEGYITQIG